MNYKEEIQQKNNERINSIHYLVVEKGQDDLEKSISDDLSYSGKEDQFRKNVKGDELKSKIKAVKLIKENLKDNILSKMKMCVAEIDIMPNERMDNYRTKEWGAVIEVPLVYSYKQRYPVKTDTMQVEQDQGKSKQEKMHEYNNYASEFVDCSIECKKLDTIIEAINDKINYKLPISVASKIGF
jgi:hypothetical protein